MRIRAFCVLGVGIAAISWSAIFVRLAQAPALAVATYRLGISAAILTPIYLGLKAHRETSRQKDLWAWMILSGLCLALHFLSWIGAVQNAPVAIAVTLSSTHPIMVGLLSRALLGEHFGLGKAVGTVFAVIATGAMAWGPVDPGSRHWGGYLLALGASLFFALYMLIGRKVRRQLRLLSYVVPTYGLATLWLVGAAFLSGSPLWGYSKDTWAFLLLLALVPTVIGHSSLNFALGHLSATIVALSVLGEPVVASILAYIVLGEVVSTWDILCSSGILAGIFIAAREEAQNRKNP